MNPYNPLQTHFGPFPYSSGGQNPVNNPIANPQPGGNPFVGSIFQRRRNNDSLLSSQLAQEAIENGILNGARCSDVAVPNYRADSQEIDRKIDAYYCVSTDLNSEVYDNTRENIASLRNGANPEVIKARRLAIQEEVDACTNHYFTAAVHAIALTKMRNDAQFEGYVSEIESIFRSRMLDLQVFESSIKILQSQEDHELRIEIKRSDQCLKEEAQKFNLLLEKAQFFSAEKQREFDNIMIERKQAHAELMSNRIHDLAKKDMKLKNKLENKREDNSHSYKMYAERNHRDISMQEISSRERIKMTQMNSQQRLAAFDRLIPMLGQIGSQVLSQSNLGRFSSMSQQALPLESGSTMGFTNSPLSLSGRSGAMAAPARATNISSPIHSKQSTPNTKKEKPNCGKIEFITDAMLADENKKLTRVDIGSTSCGKKINLYRTEIIDNSSTSANSPSQQALANEWETLRERARIRDEELRARISPEQYKKNEDTCRTVSSIMSHAVTEGIPLLTSGVPFVGKPLAFALSVGANAFELPKKMEDFLMNLDPAWGELMIQEAKQGRNIFQSPD